MFSGQRFRLSALTGFFYLRLREAALQAMRQPFVATEFLTREAARRQ